MNITCAMLGINETELLQRRTELRERLRRTPGHEWLASGPEDFLDWWIRREASPEYKRLMADSTKESQEHFKKFMASFCERQGIYPPAEEVVA